jgi:hypothetical protein
MTELKSNLPTANSSIDSLRIGFLLDEIESAIQEVSNAVGNLTDQIAPIMKDDRQTDTAGKEGISKEPNVSALFQLLESKKRTLKAIASNLESLYYRVNL